MDSSFIQSLTGQLNQISVQMNGESLNEVQSRIGEAVNILTNPKVNIVFGGHFKAGKSTILNTLLKRSILPIGDLPETGVGCVISSGSNDRVVASGRSGDKNLPCTTEEISKVVSRLDVSGEENQTIQDIDQVQISLRTRLIPSRCLWIDTVGINDTSEMDRRARKATQAADLLIWISPSKQFLSQAEQDFVCEHVAGHGQDAIVFVINAFLHDDLEAQWQSFCQTKLPAHRLRLLDYHKEMGFTRMPNMFAVSAQTPKKKMLFSLPICLNRRQIYNSFGMKDFRNWIQMIKNPGCSMVISSRLHQVLPRLREANAQLGTEMDRVNALHLELVTKEQQIRQAIKQREDFLKESRIIYLKFVKDYGNALRANMDEVEPDEFGSYIEDQLDQPVEMLLSELNSYARRYQQGLKNLGKLGFLKKEIKAQDIHVVLKTHDTKVGTTTGAVTGAAIGTAILPGIGTAFGLFLGSMIGVSLDVKDDEKKNLADKIKSLNNAVEETRAFTATLENEFYDYVSSHLGPKPILDSNLKENILGTKERSSQLAVWRDAIDQTISQIGHVIEQESGV